MRSDLYRNYLSALDRAEPDPSFGEIRERILASGRERKVRALYWYAAGATLLAVFSVGLVTHSKVTGLPRPVPLATAAVSVPPAQRTSATMVRPFATLATPMRNTLASLITVPKGIAPTAPLTAEVPADTLALSAVSFVRTPSLAEAQPVTFHSSPIPMTTQSRSESFAISRWSAFIAGGLPVSSVGRLVASLSGAIGIRYQISDQSSLLLELRKTEFQHTMAGQTGGTSDTILTVGGLQFRNTIGGPSTLASRAAVQAGSLDIGYRFLLFPESTFSPAAEVLAGASSIGGITSDAVGVEYFMNPSLRIDLLARETQLYQSHFNPLNASEIESSVVFAW